MSKLGKTDKQMEKLYNSILEIKSDLKYQLGTIGDFDWEYFIETAERGKELQAAYDEKMKA